MLKFADKRAAPIVLKILNSAIANATNATSVSADDLFVKEAVVNAGVTMKRIMPRARGTAARINKRTSHITIALGVKEGMKEGAKEAKTEAVISKPKKAKAKATK